MRIGSLTNSRNEPSPCPDSRLPVNVSGSVSAAREGPRLQTADGRYRGEWLEERAEVLDQRRPGPDWLTLTLRAPAIASRAEPGQFVQVRVSTAEGWVNDPLLRRPLSFATLDTGRGTLSLIYRVVGRGTALLAQVRPGEHLSLLGPLGTSFPDPARDHCRPLVLVGGGLGIPPMACAAAWATAAGRRPTAILGARNAAYLAGATEVAATGIPVHPVTEDGSAGRRGLVTDLLAEMLTPDTDVWACGPNPMLAAVKDLCAARGARAWLCVERPMACGFGVCIGCVIPRADGGGYLKACVDGPVFPAPEVNVLG